MNPSPAPTPVARIVDALLALKDEAAVHIWPDDLEKCSRKECTVKVYSVRMWSPSGKTVPLFSIEQITAAIEGGGEAAAPGAPSEPEPFGYWHHNAQEGWHFKCDDNSTFFHWCLNAHRKGNHKVWPEGAKLLYETPPAAPVPSPSVSAPTDEQIEAAWLNFRDMAARSTSQQVFYAGARALLASPLPAKTELTDLQIMAAGNAAQAYMPGLDNEKWVYRLREFLRLAAAPSTQGKETGA